MGPVTAGEVTIQISLDPIVVEQRIVHVEEKNQITLWRFHFSS
jgi:hypothetical protein